MRQLSGFMFGFGSLSARGLFGENQTFGRTVPYSVSQQWDISRFFMVKETGSSVREE